MVDCAKYNPHSFFIRSIAVAFLSLVLPLEVGVAAGPLLLLLSTEPAEITITNIIRICIDLRNRIFTVIFCFFILYEMEKKIIYYTIKNVMQY